MKELENILALDKKIRNIAKFGYDGKLIEYLDSNKNSVPDKKLQKSFGMNMVILSDVHKNLNNGFGDVSVDISIRPENISMIFYNNSIYSVSVNSKSDYSKLVENISKLLSEN